MRKKILMLTLALATITLCNAQKIEVKKVFGGYKYMQNEKPMSMRGLIKAMELNADAYQLIKKASTNNTLANILGGAGGALIGFPIGTSLGGGDANWALAGIGAGLIVVSIPISSSLHKNAKQAVDIYNASLNETSFYHFKPKFNMIANQHGIGLSMNF